MPVDARFRQVAFLLFTSATTKPVVLPMTLGSKMREAVRLDRVHCESQQNSARQDDSITLSSVISSE